MKRLENILTAIIISVLVLTGGFVLRTALITCFGIGIVAFIVATTCAEDDSEPWVECAAQFMATGTLLVFGSVAFYLLGITNL